MWHWWEWSFWCCRNLRSRAILSPTRTLNGFRLWLQYILEMVWSCTIECNGSRRQAKNSLGLLLSNRSSYWTLKTEYFCSQHSWKWMLNNWFGHNCNIAAKEIEKISNYSGLRFDIDKLWKMLKKNVKIISVDIVALSSVTLKEYVWPTWCKIHITNATKICSTGFSKHTLKINVWGTCWLDK